MSVSGFIYPGASPHAKKDAAAYAIICQTMLVNAELLVDAVIDGKHLR
jgi:hypothetical protein